MAGTHIVIEPDPVIEVFKKDIDRTLLIRLLAAGAPADPADS